MVAAKFFINYIPTAIERRCAMKLSNYAAKPLQSSGNMPPNGYEPIIQSTTGQINLGFGELLAIIHKMYDTAYYTRTFGSKQNY